MQPPLAGSRQRGLHPLLALAADQVGVGLGPGVGSAGRAGVFGLAGRFLLRASPSPCPVVVEDRRAGGQEGGAGFGEAAACRRYSGSPSGRFPCRRAGRCRWGSGRCPASSPPIPCCGSRPATACRDGAARDAPFHAPAWTRSSVGVRVAKVAGLRAISSVTSSGSPEAGEAVAGEIAVGSLVPLHGDEAGRELAVEQLAVEMVVGGVEAGVGAWSGWSSWRCPQFLDRTIQLYGGGQGAGRNLPLCAVHAATCPKSCGSGFSAENGEPSLKPKYWAPRSAYCQSPLA